MSIKTTNEIKKEIESAIYQAVGQASMCWEYPDKGGIFDTEQATKVASELWQLIDSKMEVNPKL